MPDFLWNWTCSTYNFQLSVLCANIIHNLVSMPQVFLAHWTFPKVSFLTICFLIIIRILFIFSTRHYSCATNQIFRKHTDIRLQDSKYSTFLLSGLFPVISQHSTNTLYRREKAYFTLNLYISLICVSSKLDVLICLKFRLAVGPMPK
jgi:hypothetical protein